MVPTPASPTSLLWAHQLKREHAFLLARMKTIEDKNAAIEQRDDTLCKRIDATNKVLKEYMEDVKAKEQEKEKNSERANKATLEREQRHQEDRIVIMESKLDSLKSTVENLGARNERYIFTLYTALMTQTNRQEDIFTQLRNLRNELTEVRGELEGASLGGKLTSCEFKALLRLVRNAEKIDRGDTEDDTELQQTLRRKDDSADTVVLARRVDALDAQRIEDNATINALRQRLNELEQILTRSDHEKSRKLHMQSEAKNEVILTPSPEKPLSQVTTEIEATSSTSSPHDATMSSPLQEYAMQNQAIRGQQEKKEAKIIMPLMNESVAKATLKGTRIAQNQSWKPQPNATRKRKALTPAPTMTRETRSRTRLSNCIKEQQIFPANGQTRDYDRGPICKDSQPSRERKLVEQNSNQQQPKKRRQIIQFCELEEPD